MRWLRADLWFGAEWLTKYELCVAKSVCISLNIHRFDCVILVPPQKFSIKALLLLKLIVYLYGRSHWCFSKWRLTSLFVDVSIKAYKNCYQARPCAKETSKYEESQAWTFHTALPILIFLSPFHLSMHGNIWNKTCHGVSSDSRKYRLSGLLDPSIKLFWFGTGYHLFKYCTSP